MAGKRPQGRSTKSPKLELFVNVRTACSIKYVPFVACKLLSSLRPVPIPGCIAEVIRGIVLFPACLLWAMDEKLEVCSVYELCWQCSSSLLWASYMNIWTCFPRGSHIDVVRRSVCNRDQNGIKWSTLVLRANQGIKMNSERLISTDQCTLSDT